MVDANSILAKLRTLESVNRSIRDQVHGAQDHKYHMDPPVPLELIGAWENANGVSLPTDYREFLLRVGNGPCGPGFGLNSFPQQNPLAGRVCQINGIVVSSDPRSAEQYSKATRDDQGFLRISTYGCAMDAILILTGDFAGQVWLDGAGTGDVSPFPPVLHDLSRPDVDNRVRYSFLEWYDDWLDCAIDGRAAV